MGDAPSHVMIFAAGFGTRMRPLTDHMPKPLIKVAGTTLLDHAMVHARALGKSIVVNGHYHAGQIEVHLPDTATFITEPDAPLETGGGLKNALTHLGPDPVFTLNPDAIWKGANPLSVLEQAWDPSQMDGLLLMVPQNRARGHGAGGDFALGPDGALSRDKTGAIYTGAQIIKTDLVRRADKDIFSLNEVWEQMIEEGSLRGVLYPGHWVDVGTPAGIDLAEDLLREPGDV